MIRLIADASGVVRVIIGTMGEGESITYNLTVVTIIRTDSLGKKETPIMKHMGVKLHHWKTFSGKIYKYLDMVDAIHEGDEVHVLDYIGSGIHITMSTDYPFLQFRENYLDDGEKLPGHCGARITFDELDELRSHLQAFNNMIPALDGITLCDPANHDDKTCRVQDKEIGVQHTWTCF